MSKPASSEPVQDVVSALRQAAVSSLSAAMRVEVPGDIGYLFFLDGSVVHATTLDLEGEPAVTAILSWGVGRLTWCERRGPRVRSVTRHWSQLAGEAVVDEPAAALVDRDAVHFPSVFGLRQALGSAEFKNALRIGSGGGVTDSRGSIAHLKPILRSSVSLGDSLGAALGLGPLIAAEAAGQSFHRVVARSTDDSAAVETSGGPGLKLARAFLKL